MQRNRRSLWRTVVIKLDGSRGKSCDAGLREWTLHGEQQLHRRSGRDRRWGSFYETEGRKWQHPKRKLLRRWMETIVSAVGDVQCVTAGQEPTRSHVVDLGRCRAAPQRDAPEYPWTEIAMLTIWLK